MWLCLPSVYHLVAFLHPVEAGHLFFGRGPVEVNYHVVLRHELLKGVHDVAEINMPNKIVPSDIQ